MIQLELNFEGPAKPKGSPDAHREWHRINARFAGQLMRFAKGGAK